MFLSLRSYVDQLTIIDRIKACHNPKITPENKPKMEVRISWEQRAVSVIIVMTHLKKLINHRTKQLVPYC